MKKNVRAPQSVWTLKRRSAPALLVLFVFTVVLAGLLLSRARFEPQGFSDALPITHLRISASIRGIFDGTRVAVARSSRFAVIIDNLIDARPQAGVNQAGLVIEAPAEAGITRWLAFYEFDCQLSVVSATGGSASGGNCQVSKIGPVRSLRPYFLELAEGYRTPVAHVGGSPEALMRAKNGRLFTMNEFFFGRYFFRDPARIDPHRILTSAALLSRALEDVGVSFQELAMPWKWKKNSAPVVNGSYKLQATSYKLVNYPPPPETEISWTWNPTTEMFERRQGSVLEHDTDGAVIAAKTVFVVETSVAITDAIGRRRITTTGIGTAWLLTPSGRQRLIWKRTADTPFAFTTTSGQNLVLEPGKVWITIVPSGQQIAESFSQPNP